MEEKCSKLKSVMESLKTQLYAKFGNHINLEADEEWHFFKAIKLNCYIFYDMYYLKKLLIFIS